MEHIVGSKLLLFSTSHASAPRIIIIILQVNRMNETVDRIQTNTKTPNSSSLKVQ